MSTREHGDPERGHDGAAGRRDDAGATIGGAGHPPVDHAPWWDALAPVGVALLLGALIVLVTAIPFLPGRHDIMAVPFSAMAQVFGMVGLVLVPIGAWRLVLQRSRGSGTWRRRADVAATAAIGFVVLALSLAALLFAGLITGAVTLLAGIFVLAVLRRGLACGMDNTGRVTRTPTFVATALLVVPIVVFLAQRLLAEPLVTFSRDRAIDNSAELIREIETYRATNGHYPPSLLSVWQDRPPRVIGIPRYHYERAGESFNLCFEQFTFDLAAREFVVYNPLDQQVMTSHDLDLLQFPPDRLARSRGFFESVDCPQPHWTCFRFD